MLKSEIVEATFRDMLKDQKHYAVNVTDIVKEIEKNGCTISLDSVRKFLRNSYDKGLIEYKITNKGKCWRLCGTNNPFPPEHNELIFDAVKEINDETGKPATTTQVMQKIAGVIDLERQAVSERLKAMVYREKTLLFAGNFAREGVHAYVVNTKEHNPIMSEIRKRKPKIPSKKSMIEETVERLGGYMQRDISYARSHTNVRDEFDVYVKKTGLHNTDHEVEKRHLRVACKQPHICIFEDGTSLPWVDFAALYMNNQRLSQTMY